MHLFTIEDGRFRLDGGAMFGIVPRPVWQRTNPPDDRNRIDLASRVLVIRAGGRTVLVDAGIGDRYDARFAERYDLRAGGSLRDRLPAAGIPLVEVTDVIVTHLHFDHAGGLLHEQTNRTVPTFPNAQIHVQAANLAAARAPVARERASYPERFYDPLFDSGRIVEHAGDWELLPGIGAFETRGHTDGHQVVRVETAGRTCLFCGDLVPTVSHLPESYGMSYDVRPLDLASEKRELLGRAASEGWTLIFGHDPVIEACTVMREPDGRFRRGERVALAG